MIDFKKYVRGEKGFTLVEMMVVLIIIAVLIAGGIKFYIGYVGKSKITKATGDITTMQAALDSYYASNYKYPDEGETSNLASAGLSVSMIATYGVVNDNTIPYRYATNASGYEIWTNTKLDGNNFVIGSGGSGISLSPLATVTTYPES